MRSAFAALPFVVLIGSAALLAEEARGIRLSEAKTTQWRFGVVVRASGGPVSGILATLPVPMDWPEQQVTVVREEKSPQVTGFSYRQLGEGVKQLVVSIPKLAGGEEASALLTLDIARRNILEPSDLTIFKQPASNAKLAKYLAPSPFIESNHAKIKSLATELTKGKDPAWERTAVLFDWVRANVKYEFAETIKPAVAAIKDGEGDCEELSSLVIALCRASKIPARAVWIPGHCYPEFYLTDDRGQGHWFPCQAAGAERQFGSMIEERPILQKGDNFKVPEERGPQRYVKQFLSAKDAAAPPEVKFIMEPVKTP